MRNYFLSHVFDKDGASGADAGAPAGDQSLGNASAGDPAAAAAAKAGDKDPAAPKPPKERSRDDVVNDRFAELTRRNTETANRAATEKARADKAEAELTAARALLARQPDSAADPGADPAAAARKPPPFRPVIEERSVEDILNSQEGRAAIARQATADRQAAEISARGDEVYEKAVSQFGEAKVSKALSNFMIFDGIKPELAEAVFELGDDAAAVLMEIAGKPATIEKLYAMTPARMGAAIAAIATTVKKPALSKLGEPPGEMGGRGNAGPVVPSDTNTSMGDWVRAREDDLKRRGVRL